MKGKIYQESNNINEDQAKVLFNYYQQMAEKIVQEEEHYEKEIAKLEEDKAVLLKDLSKNNLWKWVLAILIIPFVYFLIKGNNINKQITIIDDRINEFKKLHAEIFRDYKVSKLGVAYVPIANQIEYEDKSFIIDNAGIVNNSEVKLQISRQNDLLIDTISDLEDLTEKAPLVEGSEEIEEIDTDSYSLSMQKLKQHDYFGKLERSLRTISFCMDDLDVTSVSLPLVANNSSYLNFLNEYSTKEVPEGAPVFEVFDLHRHDKDVAKFQELNKLKDSLSNDTAKFEDVLKELMMTMANSVQAISALKVASNNKVVFESNKVLYKILKSAYNHYSPSLEAVEIERIRHEDFNYSDSVQDYEPFQLKDSSRVRYNIVSDTWAAEDGSTTNFPFGVHQIHEEIVAPIVNNLMKETKLERLKIYNHIKDQKINYLNKWHQDTEDFYGRNRAESADLINLMRASLRDYVAAYNTLSSLRNTEDTMKSSEGSLDSTVVSVADNSAETLASFEMQSKEFHNVQLDFESYMERLKEDIDIKASKFEHIDYYDALLRDGNSRDIAVAASEMNDLDERRKPLISVNPLFAKISELPPLPSVEDITFEHISINLPTIARNVLNELEEEIHESERETEDETEDNTFENENLNEVEAEEGTEESSEGDEAYVDEEDEVKSVEDEDEIDTQELDDVEEDEDEFEGENDAKEEGAEEFEDVEDDDEIEDDDEEEFEDDEGEDEEDLDDEEEEDDDEIENDEEFDDERDDDEEIDDDDNPKNN